MKNRRLWFLVHGWLSLPVWVLFCFICLTGTIAVVSHELTWLTNPAARATNPEGLPPLPLAEQVAAVRRAMPEADIGTVMRYEPWLVTGVYITPPNAAPALAYVNPYSGEIQAVNSGLTLIGFMRSLHSWLLFPWQHNWSWGYYIVSALSVVVLGAAITGMVVYKRFWRGYFQPTLRWRSGARVLLGDLHRLAGIWSLWFLLIIGLTGFWYLVQAALWHNDIAVAAEPEPLPQSALPIAGRVPPPMVSLEEALGVAQRELPGVELKMGRAAEHSRDYHWAMGAGDELLFDPYSHQVAINPWSGEVAFRNEPSAMGGLQTIAQIVDPLHYGTLAGGWTKALWFLFGLVLSGMSITGFLIWSKRTFAEARPRRSRVPVTAAPLEVNA
jgi:uncharacterized iron-regulated membrane protein